MGEVGGFVAILLHIRTPFGKIEGMPKKKSKHVPRKKGIYPEGEDPKSKRRRTFAAKKSTAEFLNQLNSPNPENPLQENTAKGENLQPCLTLDPPTETIKKSRGRPSVPEHLTADFRRRQVKAEAAALRRKLRDENHVSQEVANAVIKQKIEAERAKRNATPEPDGIPEPASNLSPKRRGEHPRVKLKFDPHNAAVRLALPHIFGWKWYAWAKAFYLSKNKMNLLCAANQISKSSTQIRKCITWATDTRLWAELWPNRRPRIFWYMYPSNPVILVEFEKKWLPEFLPRGGFENDERFGYWVERKNNVIIALHFHSGVSVYFKTYAQNVNNLQTATVDAIFTDEELPEEIYDEVKARLFATGGYFSMVFTATLNQDMWRRALEGEGDQELFPDAFKLQVSMYDCLQYDDGSPSHWTVERIREIEADCKSELEVARRVRGKFVSEAGRTFPTFDASKHFVKPQKIPANWNWYAGVDIGGGGDGHPAAIVFIAVRPDQQAAFVALGWRGDGEITTAGDVLQKYLELKPRVNVVRQVYDWQAKDFKTIAGRVSETVGAFEKADKGHEVGETTVNTVFRAKMLFIFDTPELRKLGGELSSLMKKTLKPNAKDDFCDALRYAVMSIPWDFSAIAKEFDYDAIEKAGKEEKETKPLTEAELTAEQIRERRGEEKKEDSEATGWREHFDDVEEWNDAYG